MQESKLPGSAGPKAPCVKAIFGDAVLNCAILAVAPTGIVLVSPFLASMIESGDV